MESLYTKYRPQTFDAVVGQRHVVSTLERAVVEGRTSHAYLFCGPRGTGKTTMARLLAKALMCEQAPGHLPDGTCEQCQLIASGEHPDVYELDAASRTGVDNVREEIINRVGFAPVMGQHKVYIIDEVHMLTTAAFNALLKTLEEPPSHVVFVLCTTDPQQIPETILSRVQRFDFHAISNADIASHLAYVCDCEGFAYDEGALDLVVRHARGGMRDALTTLEQLSVFGSGSITLEAAQDMLGEVAGSMLSAVTLSLAARDVASLFEQVARLVEQGRDLLRFVRELAAHLRDVYVTSVVGPRSQVVGVEGESLERLSAEAVAFGSADRVAHALAVMGDVSTEMRVAPNQRLSLEVAFTKLARPETDLTLEALADRVAILEQRLAEGVPVAANQGESQTTARSAAEDEVGQEGLSGRQQNTSPNMPSDETHAGMSGALSDAAQENPGDGGQGVPIAPDARQAESERATAQSQSPQVGRGRPDASRLSRQGQSDGQGARVEVSSQAGTGVPANTRAHTTEAPRVAGGPAITDTGELQRRWRNVVDGLLGSNATARFGSLLIDSTVVADDGTHLQIALPPRSSWSLRMLARQDVTTHIENAVRQAFGQRKLVYGDRAKVEASSTNRNVGRSGVSQARPAMPQTQAPASAPAPAQVRAQASGSGQASSRAQDRAQARTQAQDRASIPAQAPAPVETSASAGAWDRVQTQDRTSIPAQGSVQARDRDQAQPVDSVPAHVSTPTQNQVPAQAPAQASTSTSDQAQQASPLSQGWSSNAGLDHQASGVHDPQSSAVASASAQDNPMPWDPLPDQGARRNAFEQGLQAAQIPSGATNGGPAQASGSTDAAVPSEAYDAAVPSMGSPSYAYEEVPYDDFDLTPYDEEGGYLDSSSFGTGDGFAEVPWEAASSPTAAGDSFADAAEAATNDDRQLAGMPHGEQAAAAPEVPASPGGVPGEAAMEAQVMANSTQPYDHADEPSEPSAAEQRAGTGREEFAEGPDRPNVPESASVGGEEAPTQGATDAESPTGVMAYHAPQSTDEVEMESLYRLLTNVFGEGVTIMDGNS